MKKIPNGVTNFREMMHDYYFVDKTRFIAKLIDRGDKVTLCTRPRRFGKTLILSMLMYFFSIENADKNRSLFKDLEIAHMDQTYMNQQGTFPVIFISFKEIYCTDFNAFIKGISSKLSTVYKQFRYILDSDRMLEIDKEDFFEIYMKKAPPESLCYALQKLTEFLHQYYDKEVVVLVDEYDYPVIQAWQNGFYDECIDFMKILLGSCLKDNDFLNFAVMTGITRISKESIFSGLNNIHVDSVLSNTYDDIYGFTQDEVRSMIQYYDVADRYSELQEWYDGYIFGNTEIYNPWSVLNYIKNDCNAMQYWINTSENIILSDLLQNTDGTIRRELEDLMYGNSIRRSIDEFAVYNDIEKNTDALFSVLVASGYLKIVQKKYDQNTWRCELKIPNKEIFEAYKYEIGKKFSAESRTHLSTMIEAMLLGDEQQFYTVLQRFIENVVSYFDAAKDVQENFYHGCMLGLIASMEETHVIQSNRESGDGRFDLACIPKDSNTFGVLLEIKSSVKEADLNRDAYDAIQQIQRRKYDTLFSTYDVSNIWKYGIAFYKKQVVIKKTVS